MPADCIQQSVPGGVSKHVGEFVAGPIKSRPSSPIKCRMASSAAMQGSEVIQQVRCHQSLPSVTPCCIGLECNRHLLQVTDILCSLSRISAGGFSACHQAAAVLLTKLSKQKVDACRYALSCHRCGRHLFEHLHSSGARWQPLADIQRHSSPVPDGNPWQMSNNNIFVQHGLWQAPADG